VADNKLVSARARTGSRVRARKQRRRREDWIRKRGGAGRPHILMNGGDGERERGWLRGQ
jgi:hypothetical protein